MRRGLLSVWWIWDKLYYLCSRLQYVDKQNGNLFRVVIKRYRGEPIATSDGVILKKGDWYAKLHLHNYRLACILQGVQGELQVALTALNGIRHSLPALADFLARHPRANEIQILMGTTFLHRGATRLGFDVQELSNPFRRWYKAQFFKVILMYCHPEGFKRLSRLQMQLIPNYVYISKGRLFQRYRVGI